MLNAYFFIINYYLFYSLVKLIIETFKFLEMLFIIKKRNKIYLGDEII